MTSIRTGIILAILLSLTTFACLAHDSGVTVGAARTTQYIPQLKGKRVALFSNHTGMVGDSHNMASAALPMPASMWPAASTS